MIHDLEIKRAMVDLGSAVNVCSQNFLQQLESNDVTISSLEEPSFRIRSYDSLTKKPLGFVT